MIPNAAPVAQVTSTFKGEDVEMEASAEDLAHLMGVLSDIYSDPTAAVVREYTVNAIDSHVEAGQPRPVEIRLPNAFSSNLVIQDFGVGMNAQDIRKVYSKYGKSTKRTSNLQSGMLGIGAKSAFAYSNGFLVTGIKDGVKTHVSVNRARNGGGVMTIINESETTDGNGVTISIPVSNTWEMKNAVTNFCTFLAPGLVRVDGEDLSRRDDWELLATDVTGELEEEIEDEDGNIETIVYEGIVIRNLWRVPSSSSRIIMGNVPYVPNNALGTGYGSGIYAEVAMGAVVFEPSRESLKDSPLTRKTEELVKQTYVDLVTKQVSEEIAGAATKADARKMLKDLQPKMAEVGIDHLIYKGEKVPNGSGHAIAVGEKDPHLQLGSISEGYGSFSTRSVINYDALDGIPLIITGAPEHRKPGPVFRQRILNYAKRVKNVTPDRWSYMQFILLRKGQEKLLNNEWVDFSDKIVDWSEIKNEPVDRSRLSGGGGVKTAGKHFVINEHGVGELQEVDEEEEILYVTASEIRKDWDLARYTGQSRPRCYAPYEKFTYQAFMSLVRQVVDEDTLIVDVYGNRLEKFKRDYPDAQPLTLDSVCDKMEAVIIDKVTDADIQASLYVSGISDTLLALLPDDDDDVQVLRSIGHPDSAALSRKKINLASGLGNEDFAKRVKEISEKAKKAYDAVRLRYPLLSVLSSYVRPEHHEIVRKHLAIDFTESQEDNNDAV